jgi:pentatricopeptide repeat protein
MIPTHLKDVDAKLQDFIAELTKAGYFPEDKSTEEYKSRLSLAESKFYEKTTVALSTQYKDLGNEKMMSNDLNIAKKLYSESIRLFPTAVAYTNRGKAFDKLMDLASAQEDYRNAIKSDPTYPKSYIALVHLLVKSKKVEEAKEVMNNMIQNVKDKKSIDEAQKAITTQKQ